MQPLIDEGALPRVEAPSPSPAADAAASAAAATAATAVPPAFRMHGAALALSGTNPPFIGSTVFEAFPTSQTSDTGNGSGSGSSSSAAFLDLHGATTPLSELPVASEHLGPHDGVLPSPTLAGRKRSQPTGGWSSSNDGNDQERAIAGADSSSTCMRRNQDHDHSEARPSRFIMQGAAAATAAAGVDGGKGEVGDDFLTAGGGSSGTTTSGASTAEEMELDVGDTPVAYPQAATNHQLGGDATRSTSSEAPAATFVAEPSTVGPAVVVPAATTETTAAAAAAAAAAVFVPGVAATADAVDGSAADPVSCLGDYNFSFEELNKMSKRYPTVNTLADQTPMPLLGWLTRELDMNHYDMRCLILRHPRLMAYRVTSHVAPKTKWLRERLGLGQAALRKLVTTYPAVLSRSVEKNLEPKFKWLEARLGASQEEVAVLIKRFPLIFGYSTTQNLEPTVLFFMVDLSGGQEEIKSAIMSCPSILSRSLDKRMLPRAQQMREKDIEPRFGPHKWVVSTYTDKQFTRWLEEGYMREVGYCDPPEENMQVYMPTQRTL